jgi:hypothetical protein
VIEEQGIDEQSGFRANRTTGGLFNDSHRWTFYNQYRPPETKISHKFET